MNGKWSGDGIRERDWEQSRKRCLALAVRLLRSREDAEEAVQEAMIRGWRHAGSCRNKRNPTSWLMTITRRECSRLARRRGCRGREAGLEACAEMGDGRDLARETVSVIDLRKELKRLPNEDRRLLDLCYEVQLTQAEIAEKLDLPEGTVKTKLRRIRLRLRSAMAI